MSYEQSRPARPRASTRPWIVLSVALALVALGCEGAELDVQSSEAPIINGTLAQHTDWGGVVALESQGQIICTGSVIAPRAVVTAAHCIEEGATIDAIRYGANQLVDQETGETLASAPRIAVTGQMGMSSEVFDLAVLTLGEDFPGPIYPLARGCGAATQGGEVTLVGYGTASRPGEDITFGILNQRTLSVNMLSCNDSSLGCPSGPGVAELVTSPAGMCGGDSGGPIFVVNEHGRFVAGVVSGPTLDEPSDDCGDWMRGRYPRPDTAVAYIEGIVGSALPQPTCNGGGTDAGPGGTDAGTPSSDGGTPPPMPGTDAGPGGSMGGGCSASAPGASSALGALSFLLGFGWVVRRRRRHSPQVSPSYSSIR